MCVEQDTTAQLVRLPALSVLQGQNAPWTAILSQWCVGLGSTRQLAGKATAACALQASTATLWGQSSPKTALVVTFLAAGRATAQSVVWVTTVKQHQKLALLVQQELGVLMRIIQHLLIAVLDTISRRQHKSTVLRVLQGRTVPLRALQLPRIARQGRILSVVPGTAPNAAKGSHLMRALTIAPSCF